MKDVDFDKICRDVLDALKTENPDEKNQFWLKPSKNLRFTFAPKLSSVITPP